MSFNWFWLLENLWSRYFLMTLSIKNSGYAFLIRLDLMFSMSLWKEFQVLQILNNLSIKHLIKLILFENGVKVLKFKGKSYIGRFVICLKCDNLVIDIWKEYIKKNDVMASYFFYCKFNVRMSITERRTRRSETIFSNWKPVNNKEKWFLFHLKSFFRSQDI